MCVRMFVDEEKLSKEKSFILYEQELNFFFTNSHPETCLCEGGYDVGGGT